VITSSHLATLSHSSTSLRIIMQFTKRRKVKYLYPGKISKDLILASSRRCKVHCACSQAFLTNPRRPLNDWSMVPIRRTMTTGQKRGGKNFRSLRSVAREKIVRGRAAGPARWTLWVVPVRIPGCLVGFARPTPPPVLTIAEWGVRNRWWRRRRRRPLPLLRDQSSCASTTPGFGDGIASFTPALSLPHITCGRERRALSLFLSLFLVSKR